MDPHTLQTLNEIEQRAYALKAQLTPNGMAFKADAILTVVNDIRRRLATEGPDTTDKQILHG